MMRRPATKLKLARMEQGYTQRGLAQLAEIHFSSLSNIECRRLAANARHRAAICEVLNCRESDFFDSETGLAK